MVRFAPFFFFFEFWIELAGWRRYRWLRPIQTNLALIGAHRPDSTRVDASRETKKKKLDAARMRRQRRPLCVGRKCGGRFAASVHPK